MIRFVVFSSLFFVFFLNLSAQKPVKEFKSLVRNDEFEKALLIYDRHSDQFGIHEELEPLFVCRKQESFNKLKNCYHCIKPR